MREICEGIQEMPSGVDDALTARVIWCIIQVHQKLGPGFLETVYRRALLIELERQRLAFETEKEITVFYDEHDVGRHRLDLLVEGRLILEMKAVESLAKAHYAQTRAYMKSANVQRALLVNFSGERADFRRLETSVRGTSSIGRS